MRDLWVQNAAVREGGWAHDGPTHMGVYSNRRHPTNGFLAFEVSSVQWLPSAKRKANTNEASTDLYIMQT